MLARWMSAAALAVGLVAAAAPVSAEPSPNRQVFDRVAQQVQRYAYFTIFDSVHAAVDDGVVTLTGKVTMPYKATDIAKRVGKVEGVTAVVNQIDVLPVSLFDDQLRLRIAHAIYRNSSLFQYGLGANPSIHIIVEHGKLTLDGVVNSDMDRQIARSVAGFFGTFAITNDLKTEKEMEMELEQL